MSYNQAHDCPANPCLAPGKVAGSGAVFLGATLNDTVAIAVLQAMISFANNGSTPSLVARRDVMVEMAFVFADEFCAQRYARAVLARKDSGEVAAG